MSVAYSLLFHPGHFVLHIVPFRPQIGRASNIEYAQNSRVCPPANRKAMSIADSTPCSTSANSSSISFRPQIITSMHSFFIAIPCPLMYIPRHSMNAYDSRKESKRDKPNKHAVGIVIRNKISLQNSSPICFSELVFIKILDEQLLSRLTTSGVLLLDRPFIDLIGMEMMSMSMTMTMTIVLAALLVVLSMSAS